MPVFAIAVAMVLLKRRARIYRCSCACLACWCVWAEALRIVACAAVLLVCPGLASPVAAVLLISVHGFTSALGILLRFGVVWGVRANFF